MFSELFLLQITIIIFLLSLIIALTYFDYIKILYKYRMKKLEMNYKTNKEFIESLDKKIFKEKNKK